MAYNWTKDEEITAAKLNAMQQWPNMSVVNRSGVGIGGIDGSVLSEEVLDSDEDPNPVIEDTPMKEITEHETGNFHYENNEENKVRQLKTNVAGVTGKENYSAQTPIWFCCDAKVPKDGKAYIWEKISTTSSGQITNVTRCINQFSTRNSDLWDPVSNKAGIVWKRIGTIGQSQGFTPLPKGPGQSDQAMPWSYCVVNENNTVLLPIARRWGWVSAGNNIDISCDTDVKNRESSSKWVPTVLEDNHLSTPIQGVGELGGVFVYNTYSCGCDITNRAGIGIASGVEFYDWVTVAECYNCHEMRPKSTRACASIGYGGSVAIENINPKHPWQFKLTTTPLNLPLCAGFSTAIWTAMDNDVVAKNNKYTLASAKAYETEKSGGSPTPVGQDFLWGVQGKSLTPSQFDCYYCTTTQEGGDKLRVAGLVKPYVGIVDSYKSLCQDIGATVGVIKCGVLGIPMANHYPNGYGMGTADRPFKPLWNSHGGLIRGILADIPLSTAMGAVSIAPHIDCYGFIHIYAPLIPCDMPVARFNNTDCYIHYECIGDLTGTKVPLDPWNHTIPESN